MKHKVQAHIDEIEFCKKILPILEENIILEVSQFDTALMKKPSLISEKVKHWGYQKGFNYGYSSRRKVVLHRDNYTCQCCGKKNCRLEVHHIIYQSRGGNDDENNLITLCEDCHKGVHNGTIVLDEKPKKRNLKHATHMSIIRSWLLKKYPDAIETFGFVTSENRNHLKLKKYHYIDACVIASGGSEFKPLDILYKKKYVSVQSRVLTKGARGEVKLHTGKIHGFKRYDKVEYLGEVCFIKSRRVSGNFTLMNIHSDELDFRNKSGKHYPPYRYIKRINAGVSTLCLSIKLEGERSQFLY